MTQGDTESYLIPGRSLLLQGTFTSGGLPEIDRTPGYSLFAMLTGMIANNVLLVVLTQIVVSMLSLWLIYRISSRIFENPAVPSVAAWLYALEPLSLLFTVRLMPETLFTLLLLVAIEGLSAFLSNGKLRFIAYTGVILAAATYVRPVAYYLVIPLAIGLTWTSRKQQSVWWKAPALLLLTVMPLLAIWQIRNARMAGYSGFSSIVEKNLYFYQSAGILAQVEHASLVSVQQRLGYPDEASYLSAHPEQREWSQARRLSFMHADAMQVLASHRWLYLRSHLTGVLVVALTPGVSEWLQVLGIYPNEASMPHRILDEGLFASVIRIAHEHTGVFACMFAFECALLGLYVMALIGCISSGAQRSGVLLLVGVVLYFLLISGGAQAVGRYRLPAMPLICILASGGIAACKKVWQNRVLGPASDEGLVG